MVEFIADYGMFLAKAVTVVVAVGAIAMIIAGASRKGGAKTGLTVEKLNDKYRDMKHVLQKSVLSKNALKQESKDEKRALKKAAKDDASRPRVYVLDFKGDIRASGVAHLREEISAVCSLATTSDQVVLRLENQGGAVHEHGLAASQLLRLKDRGIPLTVVIDKVAASGGYLMACVAEKIIAAPFSVIGSIGVIAQIPNFNRALESRGVDFEMVTAGKYKRTVTMFGKNSDEDREKLKEELEEVHQLFKAMVAEQRPSLDIDRVATGEHWYGTRAMDLGLVDELGASDDYLMTAMESADVYRVSWRGKQTIQEKLFASVDSALEALAERAARVGRGAGPH